MYPAADRAAVCYSLSALPTSPTICDTIVLISSSLSPTMFPPHLLIELKLKVEYMLQLLLYQFIDLLFAIQAYQLDLRC